MAGFGMFDPRKAAMAKKSAMAKKGKAPGAMDQATKLIKEAGRAPPKEPVTAGPAKPTSKKAPFKKGPVIGRNSGRGDSGGMK